MRIGQLLAGLVLGYTTCIGSSVNAENKQDITSRLDNVHSGIKLDGKYYLDAQLTLINNGRTLNDIGLIYSVCLDADPVTGRGESCLDGKREYVTFQQNTALEREIKLKQRLANPDVKPGVGIHFSVALSKGKDRVYETGHSLGSIVDFK